MSLKSILAALIVGVSALPALAQTNPGGGGAGGGPGGPGGPRRTPEEMRGSWAGAMGHSQWMPEVWLNVGMDYDKDGRVVGQIVGAVPRAKIEALIARASA